ncbi:hypothetical protein [Marinobacter flavimaris]|nr:hypothetical protein [Marinobacter flavimaris]
MSLSMGWEKRRPVGLEGFKNRDMLWLWCRLEESGYSLNHGVLGSPDNRANHLIDCIEDRETVGRLQEYRRECFSHRLEISDLAWIKSGGDRLLVWVHEMLRNRSLPVAPAETKFNQAILSKFEQILLAFDLSKAPVNVKKDTIENLRQKWSKLISIDPYLNWIDIKDEGQCRWLVDQVQNSGLSVFVPLDFAYPVDNKGRLLLLFSALDRSTYDEKIKVLFINDLKNKWARKKRKDDTEKVQCNLNVDAITKKNIKKLADQRGLKMGEYIDAIVAEDKERVLGQSEP